MGQSDKQSSTEEEQCLEFIKSIGKEAKEFNDTVTKILDKIRKGLLKVENGHKLVGLKNHMLLNYIINLTHLMLKKIDGESIANSKDTWRMIETRTVIEKMRGLEHKFKYEIEKKLNEAISGISKGAPKFKPCTNLVGQSGKDDDEEEEDTDSDDDDDDGDDRRRKKSDVYVPPKMVPKFYDEDEPLQVKRDKILEKARKKAVKSSIMSDLRKEFTDQPEEIYSGLGFNKANDREKMNERTEYEEKYFTRMQMSKKDKVAIRKMRSLTSGLMDIGRFSDVAVLTGQEEDILKNAGKKRKARHAMKGSKKKKARYH